MRMGLVVQQVNRGRCVGKLELCRGVEKDRGAESRGEVWGGIGARSPEIKK